MSVVGVFFLEHSMNLVRFVTSIQKVRFCCVAVLCASIESTELEDIESKVSNIRTSILSNKSKPVTNIGELTDQRRSDAGHKYPSADCHR